MKHDHRNDGHITWWESHLAEINNWTPKSWETRLRMLHNIIQRCEVKV